MNVPGTVTRFSLLLAAFSVAVAGCGGGGERERVEDSVRDREELVAGEIESVSCRPASVMWGCEVRLADGRTQACQVRVDDAGEPQGVGCQPIRGE